jgi:Rad3-related DNA helicase
MSIIPINDKSIYFPIRYIPKGYQIEALDFIKKSIMTNKKYILLNLPTGTGKSFISVAMFANWYKNFVNDTARFDVLTNSKVLQEQYLRDFEFINNYKGRSNYICEKYDTDCANGKELCKILKSPCDSCPYDIAKNKWLAGDIGLTNFHLFNTLSLYQIDTLKRRDANVLIIDESHDFESVYSDFLSTKVSAKTLKKSGFSLKEIEDFDTKFISKIKYLDKYLEFLERKLIPMLEKKLSQFESEISHASSKKKPELSKYIQHIEGKLLSFKHLFESHKNDPSNIVLDISINKSDKMYSGVELITQHVWVYEYIHEYVWKHYDHIIFMSASILDKKMFSFINGLEDELTSYYEIPTPFAAKNRKIFYMKVGKMSWSSKEETFQKQIPWIKKILAKYKDSKGIIHTTNYEITEWLKENLMDSRLLFHTTDDRNEILEKHLGSKEPTVLVSPSMMSGIDLKDDLARFQILLKVPYPNISSNKIKSRQKTNSEWYVWKTVVDTLQMYGRSTRSDVDYSDTFILDSNFSDLLKYNSHIIPDYMLTAIKQLKV